MSSEVCKNCIHFDPAAAAPKSGVALAIWRYLDRIKGNKILGACDALGRPQLGTNTCPRCKLREESDLHEHSAAC